MYSARNANFCKRLSLDPNSGDCYTQQKNYKERHGYILQTTSATAQLSISSAGSASAQGLQAQSLQLIGPSDKSLGKMPEVGPSSQMESVASYVPQPVSATGGGSGHYSSSVPQPSASVDHSRRRQPSHLGSASRHPSSQSVQVTRSSTLRSEQLRELHQNVPSHPRSSMASARHPAAVSQSHTMQGDSTAVSYSSQRPVQPVGYDPIQTSVEQPNVSVASMAATGANIASGSGTHRNKEVIELSSDSSASRGSRFSTYEEWARSQSTATNRGTRPTGQRRSSSGVHIGAPSHVQRHAISSQRSERRHSPILGRGRHSSTFVSHRPHHQHGGASGSQTSGTGATTGV